MTNPLLAPWTGPFGLPDFSTVRDEDFAAAFEAAMAEARAEVDRIAANPEPPSFANTITALELSDATLERVGSIFWNLAGADTNDAREDLSRDLSPRMAAFHAETVMNAALFARVEAVAADRSGLDAEENRVLDLHLDMFVRAGARLQGPDRDRFKELARRLATLGTQFSQNLLADEKAWAMPLSAADLKGLPDFVVSAAAMAAKERGLDGHVITLSRSLITPFLQFCPKPELREKAFRAWVARGANGGATDNRAIVAEILRLREERARLLGFPHFAAFKLDREMAKTPDAVRDLLMRVWHPARRKAEADAARLTALMRAEGQTGPLRAADWRYWQERLRKAEYDLDEAELKPFLELSNIRAACFDVAGRLFGLSFHPVDWPLYHPDCRAWEVRRGEAHVGVFIADDFARPSKRSGAWMSNFRNQSKIDGNVRPIVVNVCNFAKAPEGQPNLLTFDDARTLFHEFGHALHGLLSDVRHPFISGTAVARDFVELPSQLYEHWLSEPEVLTRFARHHATGEPMPAALLEKLLAARNFDQGFATVEFTASALVDLDLHSGPAPADPMQAQAETLDRIGMPEAIVMRHAVPHFAHVFSGDGYSAGYYSYMWSEVMDADAFGAFEETGNIFDAGTAARLHDFIYAAGGSRDPAELYQDFRGRMPDPQAMLRRRGLDQAA